jgi:hypothetical protein
METVNMAKRVKRPKVVRKSLKEKLAEMRAVGYADGYTNGENAAKSTFGPSAAYGSAVNDFIRMVQSWPLAENAVVQIAGTDLKTNVTAMVPVRLFRAITTELRRLGYSGEAPTQAATNYDVLFRQ